MKKIRQWLVLPDSHGPFHCKKYFKLILKILDTVKFDGIVHLGDCVDLFQLSKYDKDPARKNDARDDIEEYRILTDFEADKAWEESLENYIEECILPEIPELARNYFDSERWIEDAKIDGRGQNLAHYDGNENEETFTLNGDELTYYIYRI